MKKKAVIVTGASSGIGQATAIKFSDEGYFVFLMGRNKEKLEEVALQCQAGASILSCDLTDGVAVTKRLAEVLHHPHYQTEILINNAGIFERALTVDSTDEQWLQQFQTNLLGTVRLTRLLLPYFLKNGKGSVLNISSTLGLRPAAGCGAYSAIKAALINWTQTLALEVAPHVRVNCLCPGIVDTPIHTFHDLPEKEKTQALQQMASLQPLERIGSPEEIAESAYFLASDKSSWTTGAIISVDGGINLK